MKSDIKLDATNIYIEGDRTGVGVSDPQYKMDVGDRICVRQGASPSAGIWFYQNNSASDLAFVGMENDHSVGFWSQTRAGSGPGWSVVMDTRNGDLNAKYNINCTGKIKASEINTEKIKASEINTVKIMASELTLFVAVPFSDPGLGGRVGRTRLIPIRVDVWKTITELQGAVESLKAEVEALKKK